MVRDNFNKLLPEMVEWDIVTWSRAFRAWEKIALHRGLDAQNNGLEIGANKGGVSLFFAKRFGTKMICSDVIATPQSASIMHKKHQVAHLIQYNTIDARAIPYPDQHFDFVVFKSLLGVVGANGNIENIEKSLAEIHRVLKPNGILFFAENLTGSPLHRFAHKHFVHWGNNWRYIQLQEMEGLLSRFSEKKLQTTGFFAAFVPKPEWLKSLVGLLDPLFFFLPKSWRYVCYGYAVK